MEQEHWVNAAGLSAPRRVEAVQQSFRQQLGNKLVRYGVAIAALIFGTLSIALILIQQNTLEGFLIVFPLAAFFPFSYLTYVAFQSEVRLERLKRDFELLGVDWDRQLAQQFQGIFNFALHIIFAILVTIAGVSLFAADGGVIGRIVNDAQIIQAMRYGFAGAYLFAVQLIYRRYTTFDLHPTVYMYSALTILAGLIINFAAFQAISSIAGRQPLAVVSPADANVQDSGAEDGTTPENTGAPADDLATGIGGGLVAIVAFSLGFFPLLAVRWLDRFAHNAVGINQRRAEELPLSLIDGISQLHETRLRDYGIDNVQNLAAVDIPFLLINTTFSAQQVIDWIDQALLYLYLSPNDIAIFTRNKIRTVSDFRSVWKEMYELKKYPEMLTAAERIERLAEAREIRDQKARQFTPMDAEQLDLVYQATENGPNLHFVVHYWKNADARRKNEYLSRVVRTYNPLYNYALGEAFEINRLPFVADKKTRLQTLHDLTQEYQVESENKVLITNPLARAGLAYLNESYATSDDLQRRKKELEQAVTIYKEALTDSQKLADDITRQLKHLGNDLARLESEQADPCLDLAKAAFENYENTKIPEALKAVRGYLNKVQQHLEIAMALNRDVQEIAAAHNISGVTDYQSNFKRRLEAVEKILPLLEKATLSDDDLNELKQFFSSLDKYPTNGWQAQDESELHMQPD